MTYHDPTSSNALCQVCGLPAATHARCADCHTLVGPEHADTALTDGLCASCWRANQEARRKEAMACG